MSTTTGVSRRHVAKGAAWAAPVILAGAPAPASAASRSATAASTTAISFQTVYMRKPTSCTASAPTAGYIDTMPCNSPASPSNSDCKNCKASSTGFWFESTNGGTVTDQTITVTYTFAGSTVELTSGVTPGGSATSGTSTWSSGNILNGWTATQTNATTITMTYANIGSVTTAKGDCVAGWNTGFFINYKLVSTPCPGANAVKVTTAMTWNYTDSTGQHTSTKNVTATGPK